MGTLGALGADALHRAFGHRHAAAVPSVAAPAAAAPRSGNTGRQSRAWTGVPWIQTLAGQLQMDLLPAEGQRLAPGPEGDHLSAQYALVKSATDFKVGHRREPVVQAVALDHRAALRR